MKLFIPFILIVLLTCPLPTRSQTDIKRSELTVNIVNIRSRQGQLCIAIFRSNEEFTREKPFTEQKIPRRAGDTDSLQVHFSLPPGEYGISVLDDTNADEQMQYRFPGIPVEGFGFSNYRQRGLKKPRFSDFRVELPAGRATLVRVKMQYFP